MTIPPEAVSAAANVLMQEIWADDRFEPDHAGIAELVLQAAAPLIAAAERGRIRQLAEELDVTYTSCPCDPARGIGDPSHTPSPFADLLGEP